MNNETETMTELVLRLYEDFKKGHDNTLELWGEYDRGNGAFTYEGRYEELHEQLQHMRETKEMVEAFLKGGNSVPRNATELTDLERGVLEAIEKCIRTMHKDRGLPLALTMHGTIAIKAEQLGQLEAATNKVWDGYWDINPIIIVKTRRTRGWMAHNKPIWYFCPLCGVYHSLKGELSEQSPRRYKAITPKLCRQCEHAFWWGIARTRPSPAANQRKSRMRNKLHTATRKLIDRARRFAVRVHGIVRPGRLKPCPFCGRYPEIEYLAGFPCVSHIHNTDECPISPVVGWSVCVWQDRAAPTRFAPTAPNDDPHEGPNR